MSDQSDGVRWSTFTIPEETSPAGIAREKRLNLIGVLVFVLMGLLGVGGMVGVRTATVTETTQQFEMEVLYASITRPGLATPLEVTIRPRSGSLPESVTLRVTSDYLAIFDEHGLSPTPTNTHTDSRWTTWTFDVPAGSEELTVSFDARLEPSVQWRRRGTVALIVDQPSRPAVEFTTWVWP